MKANYRINAGDMSVIRPMVYCRESLMTDFAKTNNLPIINENCPACFEEPKERERIKKLLSREETLYPNIHDKIRRALIPIMHDDMAAILKSYTEEALSKSRKEQGPGKRNKKRKIKDSAGGESTPPLKRAAEAEEKKEEATLAISEGQDMNQENSSAKNALNEASEEELLRELARRRAEKYKIHAATKTYSKHDESDLTGQVCTMDVENGTIRCYELME